MLMNERGLNWGIRVLKLLLDMSAWQAHCTSECASADTWEIRTMGTRQLIGKLIQGVAGDFSNQGSKKWDVDMVRDSAQLPRGFCRVHLMLIAQQVMYVIVDFQKIATGNLYTLTQSKLSKI